MDMCFYAGRRVFVTGHTGFKGAWLCRMLELLGAQVTGYALAPPTDPSLFELAGIAWGMNSITGDVRERDTLQAAVRAAQPEVIIHMAAQPLVRESYREPAYTYETNVMGTVNILECVRECESVRSFLNVTTDKVYENREWCWGYRENEPLDGFDPYSNSKSCSELVTHSYARSFFTDGRVAVSTARAGNVIGGGDFAAERIVPDCVRAAIAGEDIIVRNPNSTRPYQHVLEPLNAYLTLAGEQYEHSELAGSYNVGPDEGDCCRTGKLVDMFVSLWDGKTRRVDRSSGGPHEANYLKLDCSKLNNTFGWRPKWDIRTAVAKTVEWSKVYAGGGDVRACMDDQIEEFALERNDE